jgi:hypothetical protein
MIMTVITIVTTTNIMLLFTVPMLPVHFQPPALAIKPMAELSTDLPLTTINDLNGIHAYFISNVIEWVSLMESYLSTYSEVTLQVTNYPKLTD